MKQKLPLVLIALLFLAGAGLVVYPLLSNRLYEKDQSQVLAAYDAAMAGTGQTRLDQALEDARAYNRQLLQGSARLTDPFDPETQPDPQARPYADLLNLAGDGMMGYLDIPVLSVHLPVYHGTTADVLARGVGHLQQTPLPVGGAGIHTVLTGHTGLAGKRLFTDLTQMEIGDQFTLHVAGQELAYQVDRIDIVDPDDTRLLLPVEGQDLVTLVTCYPYGINTQRLLVRGARLAESPAAPGGGQAAAAPRGLSPWRSQYRKALLLCLGVYLPLTALALVLLRRNRTDAPADPADPADGTPGRPLRTDRARRGPPA